MKKLTCCCSGVEVEVSINEGENHPLDKKNN